MMTAVHEKPQRRVPLVSLLVGLTAIVLVCTGAAVALALAAPWLGLTDEPTAEIVACDVQEHKVPFPTEAGFAQVSIKVGNMSSTDRIFIIGVAVKDAGGQVVGRAEHRVGVPGNHTREETWKVTLTKQGGRRCEVTRAEPEAA